MVINSVLGFSIYSVLQSKIWSSGFGLPYQFGFDPEICTHVRVWVRGPKPVGQKIKMIEPKYYAIRLKIRLGQKNIDCLIAFYYFPVIASLLIYYNSLVGSVLLKHFTC